jgi:hypothetical protein
MLEALQEWFEPSKNLPELGIYFFYEQGEITAHSGRPRIVRVGTHGTRAGKRVRTLRQRLRDHYKGNREGSVFRKHLGSALLKAAGESDERVKEWWKKRKSLLWKEFAGTEADVSKTLRSKFFFRVIQVDSKEERKVFEEKIIATLASCSVCKPSRNWLGRFAWSEKVRVSGLWNSDYVDSSNRLTEKDLQRIEELVSTNMSFDKFIPESER